MQYLTNYYKNLCEQLQQQVTVLQSQLNEYLVRTGEKDGKKGTWYGPRFQADEDRPNIDFDKNYLPKIKPNRYDYILPEFNKLKPKPKPYLPYSERTGEGEEDSSVPSTNPTKRPKIDPGKIFNIDDTEKHGTEWAPKPWLNPDYVPPKFDPKAHEEMLKVFKPNISEPRPYIQKYGREDAIDSIDSKYSNNNLMDKAVSELGKNISSKKKLSEPSIAKDYITQKATSNSSMFNIGPGR